MLEKFKYLSLLLSIINMRCLVKATAMTHDFHWENTQSVTVAIFLNANLQENQRLSSCKVGGRFGWCGMGWGSELFCHQYPVPVRQSEVIDLLDKLLYWHSNAGISSNQVSWAIVPKFHEKPFTGLFAREMKLIFPRHGTHKEGSPASTGALAVCF